MELASFNFVKGNVHRPYAVRLHSISIALGNGVGIRCSSSFDDESADFKIIDNKFKISLLTGSSDQRSYSTFPWKKTYANGLSRPTFPKVRKLHALVRPSSRKETVDTFPFLPSFCSESIVVDGRPCPTNES
eukprot:scaffold824_cov327-Pavlova_lutheri.AAC.7